MNKTVVRQGYNKAAKDYLKNRDRFINDKYLKKLVKLLKPRAKILDLGCGSGKPVAEFLARKGFEVIGLDISEKQIELAGKNVPNARFEVKDMSKLKVEEYDVGAAVSFYAIFHTHRETHKELFKKINSFLPRNGLILVSMGASDWEGSEDFHGAEMWWSHYGQDRNRKIIEKAGFEVMLDEIDSTGGEKHQVVLARKTG